MNPSFFAAQLSNGLDALVVPDPRSPLVALSLWVRVGSRDEPAGAFGFAHLFEHLMFMGTRTAPGDTYDRVLEALGAVNNAATYPDQTTYEVQGPASALGTMLWLEADRLAHLGADLTQEKLDLQRSVVQNELREGYEVPPYGREGLLLPSLVYPEGHPYAHPVIGSMDDLKGARLSDFQGFFQRWYGPANVRVAVVGDVEPARTLELLERTLGRVPTTSPLPSRVAGRPTTLPAPGPRRSLDVTEPVPAGRLVLTWRTPPCGHDDEAPLDLLGDLLADGAACRLEHRLVEVEAVAQEVTAEHVSGDLGSEFNIAVTSMPGANLDQVEALVREELDRLARDPATPRELTRLRRGAEMELRQDRQRMLQRAHDANEFAERDGDADGMARELARYLKVEPADVSRVCHHYLTGESGARLRFLPRRRRTLSLPAPSDHAAPEGLGHEHHLGARGIAEGPGASAFAIPADLTGPPEELRPTVPPISFRFPSGKGSPRGWCAPLPAEGLVALGLSIPAGAADDPDESHGALALVSSWLTEGAGGRSAVDLDLAFGELGVHWDIQVRRTATWVQLLCLRDVVAEAVALVADVLKNPHLGGHDFRRVKNLARADLSTREAHPDHQALWTGLAALPRSHRGHTHPPSGTHASLAQIRAADGRRAYELLLGRLGDAQAVASGDLTPDEAQQWLVPWGDAPSAGAAADQRAAETGVPEGRPLRVKLVPRPDSTQSVIRFVKVVAPFDAPDLPAIELANGIFGGTFRSRLNLHLRETLGLTYGAGSHVWQDGRDVLWGISTSVEAGGTGRAVAGLIHEWKTLSEGVRPEELHAVRALELQGRLREREVVVQGVGTWLPYLENGVRAEDAARKEDAFLELEADAVDEAARRWLRPEDGILVIAGPPADLDGAVRQNGLLPFLDPASTD